MAEIKPHVAILGSGPTGLEAALAAHQAGFPFTLYEAADGIAGQMASWGHVQLFTPWSMNASPRMRQALEAAGHAVPDDATCPTGQQLIDQLLLPLAQLPGIAEHVRLGDRVAAVGRQGLLKHEEIGTPSRGEQAFRLLIEQRDGTERLDTAEVVLDCTGNTEANAVGDGGIPAPGESAAAAWIDHRIPDLARQASTWAGRTVMLLGAGHSAQTALRDLVALASEHPNTQILWVRRGDGQAVGPLADDPLPERARLMGQAQAFLDDPPAGVESISGVVVESLTPGEERLGVTLRHRDGRRETRQVDRLLALTGRVGNHSMYRQLQVHECYATSGPMKLAAALLGASGGGGDCLAQTSMGSDTLKNPEPGFFILGSKSYGRRNDFLMRVGWQQVEETFQLLDDAP